MSLAKSRFLTDMSHALRQPLNSVIGNAKRTEQETRNLPRLHWQIAVIRNSDEHGHAPDAGVRKWQDRINLLRKRLDRMHLPSTPRLFGYNYWGVARIA